MGGEIQNYIEYGDCVTAIGCMQNDSDPQVMTETLKTSKKTLGDIPKRDSSERASKKRDL